MGIKSVALALFITGATAASADRAIVVGINSYPGFGADEQLAGAVADSESIEARLEALGFDVTRINDRGATKNGIKAAIEAASKASKSSERFVFYFAGHGWRNLAKPGHAAIVPSDASKSVNTVEILPEEIAAWVGSVPASARTIILDSCFSGAMIGSRSLGEKERSLEHPQSGNSFHSGLASRDLRIAVAKMSGRGIVYFAASSPEQKAFERRIDGKFRGIFSNQLEKAMMAQPTRWLDVVQPVSSQVTYETSSRQKPELFPATSQTSPFLGKRGAEPWPVERTTVKTLWDQFSGSGVNPEVISIAPEMAEGSAANIVNVGDQFKIRISINRTGYLLILNKGTSGKYYLHHPRVISGSPDSIADSAQIKASQMEFPPQGQSFEPDSAGTEELRAVLMTDRQEFLKVAKAISELPKGEGRSFDPDQARDLKITDTRTDPGRTFFTADLQITVRPGNGLLALLTSSQPQTHRMGLNPATMAQINAADKLLTRSTSVNLPKSVMLSDFLPPVKNQGRQGSCVAWAIGYYAYGYALSSASELERENLGNPEFMVSPAYIYNQINFGQDGGSYIYDAAKLIKEKGAATWTEMPYTDTDFLKQPTEAAHQRADINKALDVFLVGQDNSVKADEVKAFLAEAKIPLVFGMPVSKSFMDAPSTPGFVYRGRGGEADPFFGNHAMCIVGYDDDKQAFRVVNSWGTEWGDQGFIWISYEFLAENGFEDWGFMPGGVKARSVSNLPSFRLVKGESK